MIYFTSDTHFSDPRVLRIDRRPFASMVEHDAALIATWNEIVGPDDEIWHLGDFARGDAASISQLLGALNGRKHLVIGNNDGAATIACPMWASTQHYAEIVLDEQMLVLCHYPFRTWNKMSRRSINLHGHSHGRLTPIPRQFDVGVDAQGLRPATLEQVLSRGRKASTRQAR